MGVTSIHYSSSVQRRQPKEGDEKTLKSGVVYVRQARKATWPMYGTIVGSRGQTLWEWVVKGSDRDRMAGKGRYGTYRDAKPLEVPRGYRLLECGKVVPRGAMVYLQNYGEAKSSNGWHPEPEGGFEAKASGPVRGYAIKIV